MPNDGRENTWWIVVPKCLPLAIPVDLAAKAHDDGRYTIFLGTYVQAYSICNPPRGASAAKAPPPIAEIRQGGPPVRPSPARLMRAEIIDEIEHRSDAAAFAAPPLPARFAAPPVRKRLAGPPARPRPAALPADQCLPNAEQIERMRQMIRPDGPTRPEVLEAVRKDLCKTIERYEQARGRGDDVSMTQRRLVAARAMIAAMEGNL